MTIGITMHSTQLSQSIGIPKASRLENESAKVETTAIAVRRLLLRG